MFLLIMNMMMMIMMSLPSGGDVVGSGECFSAGILSALCIIYNYCEFSYNYAWAHIFRISPLLNFLSQLATLHIYFVYFFFVVFCFTSCQLFI